jgi:hypothetical protein
MRKVNSEADPDFYPNSQIKLKHFVAICVRVFELIHISYRGKSISYRTIVLQPQANILFAFDINNNRCSQ